MSDIYGETSRMMCDYLIRHLDGSDQSFLKFNRYENPSNFIIIGTLANRVKGDSESKTSVRDNSIAIKFQTSKIPVFSGTISYSTIEKESEEEINGEYTWIRRDHNFEFDYHDDSIYEELVFDSQIEVGYSGTLSISSKYLSGVYQTEVRIVNTALSEKKDKFLFNVNFSLSIEDGELIPYEYNYVYEGRKKKSSRLFRTINCTASYDHESKSINSRHCPYFEQSKLKLKQSDDGVALSFDNLSGNQSVDILREYSSVLREYLDEYRNYTPTKDSKKDYDNALNHYSDICRRFDAGVHVIETDDDVKRSFQLMNETFLRSSNHHGWRAFQLIYIVISIPDITGYSDSDSCDVIHIPTGGGKTEAYLGLTIFSLFHERLIGKVDGTVAIVKFPLRMLSIQQMERVTKKVLFAEKIRLENEIDGSPFSLGFYVGESVEFPNSTLDAIEWIANKESALGEGNVPGKIITNCPFCDSPIFLCIDKTTHTISHYCKKCDLHYQLYYTDEEIYRYLLLF